MFSQSKTSSGQSPGLTVALTAALVWIGLPSSGQGQKLSCDCDYSVRVGQCATSTSPVASDTNGTAKQPLRPERPDSPHKHPQPVKTGYGRPALVGSVDLADFEDLPAARKKLIEIALAVVRNSPWLPYAYGGADPALGGMDCSGAMFFVMTQSGLRPPRTSAGQYRWLRDHKRLHLVAAEAVSPDHPSLARLRPGDLLFWASAPAAAGIEIPNITHVAMYLGREKRDGLQVMINATDGRSYRGTKANGYGVYDFRVPRAESKSKLAGYGSPPGMPEFPYPPAPEP
jgi:cell wall-associated NlpC family hydrolase